ncbi:hypothetical protein CA54_09100 [Symmachiella macrocystis]|uniref:Uncharacterized protein n=1 Tax=Symmachiella macrocystis TaxID=2527985 RepID=A0A5C6BK46_9PLAN|nr:hypothetical protein [Symmachiella macrocystis]TWU12092.1 hypothetical protein CA54_09100 [Symmachiella macrocystis]
MSSPYSRQMGASIAALLRLFQGEVPDSDTNSRALELAVTHDSWSAGHALRDVVRDRSLGIKDQIKCAQYDFEESCLEALYNESEPDDPFDSVSPYWVVPNAIELAKLIGIPVEAVFDAMHPKTW